MAKNDKIEEKKVAETTLNTPKPTENKSEAKPESNKTAAKTETVKPAKKRHFARNFALFTILLLGTIAGFSYYDLKQTKISNAETIKKLTENYKKELNLLGKRVVDLEKTLPSLQNNKDANKLSDEEFHNLFVALETKLRNSLYSELENNITIANKDIKPVSSAPVIYSKEALSKELLLASGALVVKDLANSGQTFAYEAEVLQLLAKGNPEAEKYVITIKSFASTGIKGKSYLIRTFNKLRGKTAEVEKETDQTTQITDAENNIKESFLARLKKLATLKKRQPQPTNVIQSKTDEVSDLINDGNLREAMNELQTNRDYRNISSKEFDAWKNLVWQYLNFERAINGLLMNCLANLHVKELSLQ